MDNRVEIHSQNAKTCVMVYSTPVTVTDRLSLTAVPARGFIKYLFRKALKLFTMMVLAQIGPRQLYPARYRLYRSQARYIDHSRNSFMSLMESVVSSFPGFAPALVASQIQSLVCTVTDASTGMISNVVRTILLTSSCTG